MLNDGYFESSDKVTFDVTPIQVRGGQMLLAYDISSIEGEEIKKFPIYEPSFDIYSDYYDYIFKDFYKVENNNIINELIEEDIKFKEFILKWVLFLENEIKNCIIRLTKAQNLSLNAIYQVLSQDPSTNNIHDKILKKIKRNYIFRHELELLTICRVEGGGDTTFKILEAPLDLYLSNTTLSELGKFTKIIFENLIDKTDDNEEDFLFLTNVTDLFLELSVVRNACAHGNPFIPLILDDNYSPNYLYDLASVFPEFNSGDSVDSWKLFEPLRRTTRQLAKINRFSMNGGTLYTGLYRAKYILINPSRRSFFSFLFILEYYFRYINSKQWREFRFDFNMFIPYFGYSENNLNSGKTLFTKYPEDRTVVNQIYSFIYPIFDENTNLVQEVRLLS